VTERQRVDGSSGGDKGARTATALYFAACAALIGFALLYALPIYARLVRPYYDPVARHWFLADHAPPIPMGYVGQLAWALAGALVCGGAAWLATSGGRAPSERVHALASAWALTALVIVAAYFTWNNWP
jgi:hypothetical protein